MWIAEVREYLSQIGANAEIIELIDSSATVELAAEALGCEPKKIAKTLSFLTKNGAILIVMAGDAKIENKKYRELFGEKAKMIPGEQVEELVGHAPGGVCPFGVKEGVKTYLDCSLKRFQTVFPAAGSANSAVELSLTQLEHYSNALEWIDVCKEWQ